MDKSTFFVTGATGLLGTEVVERLLTATDSVIYVLVRAATATAAASRLQALWWDDRVLTAAIGHRVFPVVGDITSVGVVDEASGVPDISAVPDTSSVPQVDGQPWWVAVTHVIHCAAETGVQKSCAELWRINVEGTRNVVQWARQLPRLQRFTYISTAYVAGTLSGRIMESAAEEQEGAVPTFYSLYEQSKAEAERIVRSAQLPLTVCRPGMIVGNSTTGRTRNFNTVYYVLKLMLQGKLRLLPVSRRQTVNVVPADYVASQVVELTLHPKAEGLTFHLTAPHEQLPQVGQLVDAVRQWATTNLHIAVPRPLCMPMPVLRTVGKRYNAGLGAKPRTLLSNLTALMPYFLDDHVFDRTNTDRLTGSYSMNWRAYLPALLTFACRHNFMRLTDQSIFQQAVRRRESRHFPITYFDITAQGVKRLTGREMNQLVDRFTDTLHRLGVAAGDTVALAGINCAEHAALDNAIGLAGAVSVPIYYTTPPDEIALLISKSGARWFFVGDERVMQNVRDLDIDAQLLTFGPLGTKPVSIGATKREQRAATPCSTLATIRYTSGTTGEPKGVMFSAAQLKWMGQVLTTLLPWKDRNTEMRYLSFLPMSHVVEGILAAYAPYCMLCRAKIYYLNDFQQLVKALPMVRPTVFFSVPRFYEKLWEQVEHNPLGRRYMRMTDGWLQRSTGRLLRWAVLRKAGLNKCSQLLVGSAPISEELLLNFRSIGIEIHNAYGQTEAPLITLNRLGDNVIPSIGTPLPDTTVEMAPDGELVVSGPQVALGYYRLASETFRDGQLFTGDLGRTDADGHVYISGRKKDMLITSYGKNINCSKIEQLLMGIPGVEQAVLVGEQRPYCTALLWTNSLTDGLQTAIDQMNQHLSHPEQVKRWLIVSTPLSISRGELTPNLKVKRNVVLEHYRDEIEKLYAT